MTRALPLLLLLAGCHREPSLEGSLTEILDLSYVGTEVTSSPDALVLRFVRAESCGGGLTCVDHACIQPGCVGTCPSTLACTGGSDTVFQLSIDVSDLVLGPNVEVDLAGKGPKGAPRAVCSRNLLADPRKALPDLRVGRIRMGQAPVSGQRFTGDFSVTFVEGIEYANGRTVFGSFSAGVQ